MRFDLVNVETDIVVDPGDSGGPFFWSNTALGTTLSQVTEHQVPVGSVYGPVDQINGIIDVDLLFN